MVNMPPLTPQQPQDEYYGEPMPVPQQPADEEDSLSELERTDTDDVTSVTNIDGENDDLSELERTDLDDVLSVADPDEPPKPKRVRRRQFIRTTRPYIPPTIRGVM